LQYLIVIDTNVLVSALLSKHSDTATVKVLDALYDSKIIPLYSEEILQEYEDVLHRKKFHFSEAVVHLLIQSIHDNGICVERALTGELLPDPKDLVFYEVCMVKRDEDSMLVTGNMKHFPNKPFIVTPSELLEILNHHT